MQPGESIEITNLLRAFNTSSGSCLFDLAPEVQLREFGKIICQVGRFAETTDDPRAATWYRPLTDRGFADVDSKIPVTSQTMKVYSHPNDRTDRWEP